MQNADVLHKVCVCVSVEENLELLPGDAKVYGGAVPIALPLLGLLHRNSLIRMIPTSQDGLVQLSLDDVQQADSDRCRDDDNKDDTDDGEMTYVAAPTSDINCEFLGDAFVRPRHTVTL